MSLGNSVDPAVTRTPVIAHLPSEKTVAVQASTSKGPIMTGCAVFGAGAGNGTTGAFEIDAMNFNRSTASFFRPSGIGAYAQGIFYRHRISCRVRVVP